MFNRKTHICHYVYSQAICNTFHFAEILKAFEEIATSEIIINLPIGVVCSVALSDVVSCSVGVIVTVVVVVSVVGRIVTVDRIEVIGEVFMVVMLAADVVMLVVG